MGKVKDLFVGIGALASFALASCGKPVGLSAPVTPLAKVHILVTDPAAVAPPDANLHVALMWGSQWLPEPFCFLPAESSDVAAVIAAGCRDSFGFIPNRVGADTAVVPGTPTTIELDSLPDADLMVGDLTGRVAYASLIVYDDRNGNNTLDVRNPPHHRRRNQPAPPPDDGGPAGPRDIVYGASFVSMTLPDRRVAFLEGAFDPNLTNVAFYPRKGCDPPPKLFSLLSASGFTQTEALASALQGDLPLEDDPTACLTTTLDDMVSIPLQVPTTGLAQLACTANDSGGSTFYVEAPASDPRSGRLWACASFPQFGADAGVPLGQQLVVASTASEACQYVNHYTLFGCDNDPFCSSGAWNITSTPPSWWPCPNTP